MSQPEPSASFETELMNRCLKWFGVDDLVSLQTMDETIDDFCEKVTRSNLSSFHPVDVYEREDRVEVWIDVPGFRKEDLKVSVNNTTVAVSGGNMQADPRPRHMFVKERPSPSFKRIIKLPAAVTGKDCHTSLESGVLQLSLAKVNTNNQETEIPL